MYLCIGWFLLALVVLVGPFLTGFLLSKFLSNRNRLKWLQNEIVVWEMKNLLTSSQTESILGYYKTKRPVEKKKLDTIKIVSLFGVIFIGLGIIFLVASNWQEIPKHLRTTMLLILTIGTLVLGYYSSYEKKLIKIGKSLFLLAGLFWGATLFLIAQIYHLPASDNWIILILWAVPILPISYFFENEFVYYLVTVIFGIWNIMYSVSSCIANYYYPFIVFFVMLPLSEKKDIGKVINILGLLVAAFYAAVSKYQYVSLLIATAFFIYYLINTKESDKFREVFLISSLLSFLAWLFSYQYIVDYKEINFYYIIPLVAIFCISYKDSRKATIGFNIANLIIWINFILSVYLIKTNYSKNVITVLSFEILLGVLVFFCGVVHTKIKEKDIEYSFIYKILGFAMFFGSIYYLSFKQIIDSSVNDKSSWMFFLVVIMQTITIISLLVLYLKGFYKEKAARMELLGIAIVILLTFILLFNQNAGLVITFIINGVFVALSLIIMFMGVELQIPRMFNTGIVMFVLFILTRYIDVFWKLKEKSVFFIVSGIFLVLGGVFLEKKRKEIIRRIKDE